MTKPQVHPEKKQQPPKKGDHDGGDASYGSKTKLMDKKSSSFGAVTAVPSAKIAMNNFLLLMFRLQYLHGQDKTQLVPTDDPFRLFELSFNCFELAHDYAVDWKSEMKSNLVNDEIAKKNASEYIKAKPLDVVRLRPMHLPVELHSSNIFEFELLKSPYGYELTDNGEDWYVKFADQGAFGCSETDLFASDEIIALQHPILGSVKDALKDISQNGLFVQTTWQWFTGAQGLERKDCVYFDDPKLYIPKDKSKDTLRYKEVSPKVVDLAGRPTPIIFYNVPRLCLITDFRKVRRKVRQSLPSRT
ncbi:hypothetical protein BC829DRAFT_274140 [Chytridium lagenaria]|nr:hypothetical protein BC829DRAFT_274140 [Chytridium lagenaria]